MDSQNAVATAIKTMLNAQDKKPKKAPKLVYPMALERKYNALLKAVFKPLTDYTADFVKQNGNALLKGDSLPGKTFTKMGNNLNVWVAENLPDSTTFTASKNPPTVYMALGNIAEEINSFQAKNWNKATKASLGIEFPSNEAFWETTKVNWQNQNYNLIRSNASSYVTRVNTVMEQAITSGESLTATTRKIQELNSDISLNRAKLIARDQTGKLNSMITQGRMTAMGLEMYEWQTAGDERVRSSHTPMDGLLCRWDDASVYSKDNGITWINRPSDAVQLHPGEDIQCRCIALAHFDELVL